MSAELPSEARVQTVTRKYVTLVTDEGEELKGTYSSKSLDLVVGDLVEYEQEASQIVVKALRPRRNLLRRSYRDVTKMLASNLDLLCLVTAPGSQWNSEFIDRILCAAVNEGIPCWMLFNKMDLASEDFETYLAPYRAMDLQVLPMSAKTDAKLDKLEELIAQPEHETIAFSGVSGVGKSTLLNRLVPEARRETKEVSSKSGQGTQTTTQASAFHLTRPDGLRRTLINLPGVQNFGLSHLQPDQLVHGFVDIRELAKECEFDNCSHVKEDKCSVRDSLASGRLARSRYENYVSILQEIRATRKY